MKKARVTARGVFKDLSISPYVYKTPYGDLFRFRSAKKLEMYEREIVKDLDRLESAIDRNDVRRFLTPDVITGIERAVYRATYKRIEG